LLFCGSVLEDKWLNLKIKGLFYMLWLKTFHILFVMSWMAGIFYLPRIFVHFVEGQKAGQQVDRLAIMAKKLYGFMTIMMGIAVGAGLWLGLVLDLSGAGCM
jgi:putative membrane protein